jgi:16S rRNA (adenine1518-N6/adenine1519-N6)-dimethyltransferase
MVEQVTSGYLGAAQIREIAAGLGMRPTKQWGQNFVVDANTVKRIVRLSGVTPDDSVVEVGPGLGSLTLALLPAAGHVTAVEVDPALAQALPGTVGRLAPAYAERLTVVPADAMHLRELPDPQPTALVANLPYNVSVPVVLSFLEAFPTLERVLVMVQLEVAERLAASPGSKTYGVPSVKTAWYAAVRLAGTVPRSVFWPVPNVDSGLVAMERRPAPDTTASRADTFACIDAAFAQRRKTLRAALAGWAGSAVRAEECLRAADIDPRTRGEQLGITEFAAIAAARTALTA